MAYDSPYLINFTRGLAGLDADEYPNVDVINDLIIARHTVVNRIESDIREAYFGDIVTAQLDAFVNKYRLPLADAQYGAAIGVSKVFVKYTADGSYQELEKRAYNFGDFDAYKNYSGKPFFVLFDRTVFIFPQPTLTVANGYKLHITNSLLPITATSTEEEIFKNRIQAEHNHVIAFGAAELAFMRRRMFPEAEQMGKKFSDKLKEMIRFLDGRTDNIIIQKASIRSLPR